MKNKDFQIYDTFAQIPLKLFAHFIISICMIDHGLSNDMHSIVQPLETTYPYFMKERTEIHAPTTGVYP